MEAFWIALAVFLFILVIILLIKLLSNNRKLRKVESILREIRAGNANRRIHMGSSSTVVGKLSSELNLLFDQFEQTLARKQTLELSHKQLVSNISHDIRTPLTSLLGYLEVLQINSDVSLEDQKRYIGIIESKARFLFRLIEEFFELSKLESEDTSVRYEKNDLAEIIRQEIASFYEDFIKQDITPEISIQEGPAFVWGDAISIERILQNLISNAFKYGSIRGVIGISLRQEPDKMWVDVWDRGDGIPEKDIPFIFDRLYTAEASRNGKLRGSGLGLTIVKRLVERQKGEIEVSRTTDGKTIFSFSLLRYTT